MKIAGIVKDSIVDGPGVRMAIFVSGCNHGCKGCHNKEFQNFDYGEELTEKNIEDIVNGLENVDGITLTGGDPMYHAEKLFDIFSMIYTTNIWIYTGFTFEEIIKDTNMLNLLLLCDVLVDGKYIESEKDESLPFVGSKNQRVIDISESYISGEVVLYDFKEDLI